MLRPRRSALSKEATSFQYGQRRSGEEHRRNRLQGNYGARRRSKRSRAHWDTRGGRSRELDYDDEERARRVDVRPAR